LPRRLPCHRHHQSLRGHHPPVFPSQAWPLLSKGLPGCCLPPPSGTAAEKPGASARGATTVDPLLLLLWMIAAAAAAAHDFRRPCWPFASRAETAGGAALSPLAEKQPRRRWPKPWSAGGGGHSMVRLLLHRKPRPRQRASVRVVGLGGNHTSCCVFFSPLLFSSLSLLVFPCCGGSRVQLLRNTNRGKEDQRVRVARTGQ
ncbi:unnamed protein product, partial [Ectocarpus sp. 8 AP-2014]